MQVSGFQETMLCSLSHWVFVSGGCTLTPHFPTHSLDDSFHFIIQPLLLHTGHVLVPKCIHNVNIMCSGQR